MKQKNRRSYEWFLLASLGVILLLWYVSQQTDRNRTKDNTLKPEESSFSAETESSANSRKQAGSVTDNSNKQQNTVQITSTEMVELEDRETKNTENTPVYLELPEKLLKPVEETKISRVPKERLTSDNREMLEFINARRRSHSLSPLATLPTRLMTEEVLQLTNAKRVADGKEPLKEMPTGMPEINPNKESNN